MRIAITLLRDRDGDGVAETRSEFLSDLSSPFGMALVGDTLYVANSDALIRSTYSAGDQHGGTPVKVIDLPAGTINHHWTKSLIASADGNERDELGSDLVPDYITSVREGCFYGWPFSYYGGHVDTRVKPQRPELVATAITPDYALGPHTASLGLAYSDGHGLAPLSGAGMFVGQHGSWNRDPRSGYKVIFVRSLTVNPPACRSTC